MLNKVIYRAVLVVLAVSIVSLAYGQEDESGSSERGRSRSAQRQRGEGANNVDALEALVEKAKAGEKVEREEVKDAIEKLGRRAWSLEPEQWLEKLNLLRQDKNEVSFPTREKPLGSDNALERLIVSLEVRRMGKTAAEETKAHPAAKSFPGVVEEGAERISRTVKIDTSAPGWHNNGIYGNPGSPYWHSTGLYAAPGEVITVSLPDGAVDKGLHVRIGAHSDGLWRKRSWQRAPDICRRFELDKKESKAANAFGGLVYIEVPRDVKIGIIEVSISNAVEAPYYVLGETDGDKWLSEIRNRKAPWGELATKKVVLTLPSEVLRTVDKPRELMEFWDGIMDCYADLLGRQQQRRRVERFVSDLQISAGYMHSGYPLMTMLDITNAMVDKEMITSNGHHGIWGLFHEIGHNHQNRDWTFRGTTEVTVNLFSLYVMEQICGLTDDDKPHPSITLDQRKKKMEKYFGDGAKFENWQRNPFLALIMYIQMKDEFGWDAFKKAFVQYRSLEDSERPKNDNEKRDEWLVRFSGEVGRDLGPFFEAWGVPTSEKARASIAELPEWMPVGFEGKTAVGK
jgi:hypothetical protein